MSDDEADEMRIQVKRASKKKSGYEVEKRDDGFYYGKAFFLKMLSPEAKA